jgi:hypothetical protein
VVNIPGISNVLNEQKLKEKTEQFNSLKQTVALLGNVLQNKEELTSDEATGLLKVVTDYSYALEILDRYDHKQLTLEGTTDQQLFVATYGDAMRAIKDLKDKFGGSSLLEMKRTNRSKDLSAPFISLLEVWNFTLLSKKKRRTCFTL